MWVLSLPSRSQVKSLSHFGHQRSTVMTLGMAAEAATSVGRLPRRLIASARRE
jgi:hypothetical protein